MQKGGGRMDEREELELGKLIASALPETPPDDIARGVTPWRRAISETVWGLVLCMVTLGEGVLKYAMPFAGALLLLCGTRTLRRENAGFAAAHVLAGVLTLLCAADRVLLSVRGYYGSETAAALAWAFTLSLFALTAALWPALRGVGAKAWPAAGLLAWHALLFAIRRADGLLALIMLLSYLLLLWLLWRLARSVDEAGYRLRGAPVRVSNRALVITVCALTALGIAAGQLWFDKYDMDWQPSEADDSAADTAAELAALGFPERVLDDLTAEEIRSFAGAEYVLRDAAQDDFGSQARPRTFNGNLVMTSVVAGMPDGTVRAVCHFEWLNNPGFYSTELFRVYLDSEYISGGFIGGGPVSGRVLYTDGGVDYAAPYVGLELGDATQLSFFGDGQIYSATGRFSMPGSGERQRGYIVYSCYRTEEYRDAANQDRIYAQPHYWRVATPFYYPAVEADYTAPRSVFFEWNYALNEGWDYAMFDLSGAEGRVD